MHEGRDDIPDDEDAEELDPRELARIRRRDHDADAEQHGLMCPGMGKVFKQILDRQARDADEAREHRRHHRR